MEGKRERKMMKNSIVLAVGGGGGEVSFISVLDMVLIKIISAN